MPLSNAAARLAERLDADAIICQTASGATARAICLLNVPRCQFYTVTPEARVANQLSRVWQPCLRA